MDVLYFKYSDLECRSFSPIKYFAAIWLTLSLTNLLNEYFFILDISLSDKSISHSSDLIWRNHGPLLFMRPFKTTQWAKILMLFLDRPKMPPLLVNIKFKFDKKNTIDFQNLKGEKWHAFGSFSENWGLYRSLDANISQIDLCHIMFPSNVSYDIWCHMTMSIW